MANYVFLSVCFSCCFVFLSLICWSVISNLALLHALFSWFFPAWQHLKYNFWSWQVEQLPIMLSYLIIGSHQVCLEQCCLITFILSQERHMWSASNGRVDMCVFFDVQGIVKQAEGPSTSILHYESVKNLPSGFTWFSSTYLDSINDWWIHLHCQMFSNINT